MVRSLPSLTTFLKTVILSAAKDLLSWRAKERLIPLSQGLHEVQRAAFSAQIGQVPPRYSSN